MDKRFEINLFKSRLKATEHLAIARIEGFISEEEYAPTRAKRKEWWDKIKILESEVKNEKNN